MLFQNNDINFFTAYEDQEKILHDMAETVADLRDAIFNFFSHDDIKDLLLYTTPLISIFLFLNSPMLLLLSASIATQLMAYSSILFAIGALLALPAVKSLAMVTYDILDIVISPCMDILKIVSNLGANLIESIASIEIETDNIECSCF